VRPSRESPVPRLEVKAFSTKLWTKVRSRRLARREYFRWRKAHPPCAVATDEGKPSGQDSPAIAYDDWGTSVFGSRLQHSALHLQPWLHVLAARRPDLSELPRQALGGGQDLEGHAGLARRRLPNMMALPSTFPCEEAACGPSPHSSARLLARRWRWRSARNQVRPGRALSRSGRRRSSGD
jgi:hypothetical protein